MSANSARDVGGRLMALTIWGRDAAGGRYAALAALTNILSMIVAVLFYEVFFTDSARGKQKKIKLLDNAPSLISHLSHPKCTNGLPRWTQGTLGTQGGGHPRS